jgi:hypothetical protein
MAPRPTPKLEDHSLSFLRGYLFSIFAAIIIIIIILENYKGM